MRIAVRDHRHLSIPYANALRNAGHTIVPMRVEADIALTDDENLDDRQTEALDRYAHVVLYPNGPACNRDDGGADLYPRTTLMVTTTNAMGAVPGIPSVECGFPWAPFLPYRRRLSASSGRVLMCPSHGWNGKEAERLLDAHAGMGAAVTIRHVGAESELPSGLQREWRSLSSKPYRNVTWVEADGNVDYRHHHFLTHDICEAAYGSAAILAMVHGCPTHIYEMAPGYEIPYPNGPHDEEWMAEYVGGPFEAGKFVRAMEGLL